MRSANRSNSVGVTRMSEPIVNGGTDLAALDRRCPWPRMAGNQQDDPILGFNSRLDPAINGAPGPIETVAVQVEDPVRNYRAAL